MKRLVLILLAIALPLAAFGAPINAKKAREIAESALPVTKSGEGLRLMKLYGTESEPLLYCFGRPGGGFVVVSGDDRSGPVLAHDSSHRIDASNIPDGFTWWAEAMSEGIRLSRKGGSPLMKSASGNHAILYETAEWGQFPPFNKYCPIISGQHALTGCVATAGAIIMRYWGWPERGTGVLPDYTSSSGVFYNGHALGHKYDWDSMPYLFYDEDEKPIYSSEAADAVAQLMYDLGIGAHANYGLEATGAQVRYLTMAMSNYFQYSSTAQSIRHDDEVIQHSEWQACLEILLQDGPVLYDGSNSDGGGHAFVIEGHDGEGSFRINWGWEGLYNGWFVFPNFREYTLDHGMVVCLVPEKKTDVPESRISLKGNLELVSGRISPDAHFVIKAPMIFNSGNGLFSGKIGACLAGPDGSVKKVLDSFDSDDLEPFWAYMDESFTCTFSEASFGDVVALYYLPKGSGKWYPVLYPTVGDLFTGSLPVEVDDYKIAPNTSFSFDSQTQTAVLDCRPGVSWTLTGPDGQDLSGLGQVEKRKLTLSLKDAPKGKCTLRLWHSKDSYELSIEL